jgi:hypothetical protein
VQSEHPPPGGWLLCTTLRARSSRKVGGPARQPGEQLLRARARLLVLATSREPLQIAGEAVVPVPRRAPGRRRALRAAGPCGAAGLRASNRRDRDAVRAPLRAPGPTIPAGDSSSPPSPRACPGTRSWSARRPVSGVLLTPHPTDGRQRDAAGHRGVERAELQPLGAGACGRGRRSSSLVRDLEYARHVRVAGPTTRRRRGGGRAQPGSWTSPWIGVRASARRRRATPAFGHASRDGRRAGCSPDRGDSSRAAGCGRPPPHLRLVLSRPPLRTTAHRHRTLSPACGRRSGPGHRQSAGWSRRTSGRRYWITASQSRALRPRAGLGKLADAALLAPRLADRDGRAVRQRAAEVHWLGGALSWRRERPSSPPPMRGTVPGALVGTAPGWRSELRRATPLSVCRDQPPTPPGG